VSGVVSGPCEEMVLLPAPRGFVCWLVLMDAVDLKKNEAGVYYKKRSIPYFSTWGIGISLL